MNEYPESIGTHHAVLLFLGFRDDNVQSFPDIVLQLAHIDSFRTLGVIDELRFDFARLTLSSSQQVLLSRLHFRSVVPVVKYGTIVVIVMEKLGVERNGTSTPG